MAGMIKILLFQIVSPLVVGSYNATGIKNEYKQEFVHDRLVNEKVDILLLQETWLSDNDASVLNNISDKYSYSAVSGMDLRKDVLVSRPYGGVAILWRKSLSHLIKPFNLNHNRLNAVEFTTRENIKILFINCYLPCDHHGMEASQEYRDCMDVIQSVVRGNNARDTGNTKCLSECCDILGLYNGWNHKHAVHSPTYESNYGRSCSVIDHFIVSNSIYNHIQSLHVVRDICNQSNHNPIIMSFTVSFEKIKPSIKVSKRNNQVSWNRVSNSDIGRYRSFL